MTPAPPDPVTTSPEHLSPIAQHVLRYTYPGSTPKNGRVIDLGARSAAAALELSVDDALRSDDVDLERWRPRVYDNALEGWRAPGDGLTAACWLDAPGGTRRCEVALEERRRARDASTSLHALGGETGWENARAPPAGSQNGFFAIGIYNGKNENNLGTLWRSAFQLGAAYAFVIGRRFKKEPSDTMKTWTQIPMMEYESWDDFARNTPFGAVLVGVEMGGEPLETFEHPRNAVYVLGSEDTGLNTSQLRACRHHIALPSVDDRSPSYNVAVTGAIIMYDRELKRRARERERFAASLAANRREGIDSVKLRELIRARAGA